MDGKKIEVLVVDDEADFRQLMTLWLESKGYSVIPASDGRSAVELVREKNPDIVFLDLRMPGMDGVETLKAIREFNKDIPVIVISAYVADPKAHEVITYGISGEFYKGEDFSDKLAMLESALRAHKKLKK